MKGTRKPAEFQGDVQEAARRIREERRSCYLSNPHTRCHGREEMPFEAVYLHSLQAVTSSSNLQEKLPKTKGAKSNFKLRRPQEEKGRRVDSFCLQTQAHGEKWRDFRSVNTLAKKANTLESSNDLHQEGFLPSVTIVMDFFFPLSSDTSPRWI